jgi:hypothetical protein
MCADVRGFSQESVTKGYGWQLENKITFLARTAMRVIVKNKLAPACQALKRVPFSTLADNYVFEAVVKHVIVWAVAFPAPEVEQEI